MKITIESTDELHEIRGAPKVTTRIWKGITAAGVPVVCYVASISPQTHDKDVNDQFANELLLTSQPGIIEQ